MVEIIVELYSSVQIVALDNAMRLIRTDARLPEQVFSEVMERTLFFEADQIVSPAFVDAAKALCDIEQSQTCVLVNLTASARLGQNKAAVFFVEASTTREDYVSQLKDGGPTVGWLFQMDRFTCASDHGDWCIYCERENDVALISFKYARQAQLYLDALKMLSADSIEHLTADQKPGRVPFSMLVGSWKRSLRENYGRGLSTF